MPALNMDTSNQAPATAVVNNNNNNDYDHVKPVAGFVRNLVQFFGALDAKDSRREGHRTLNGKVDATQISCDLAEVKSYVQVYVHTTE